MLIPTENRRNQGLFKAFMELYSTFQGIFNFQGLFKKPSKFKHFISLCKPWYMLTLDHVIISTDQLPQQLPES